MIFFQIRNYDGRNVAQCNATVMKESAIYYKVGNEASLNHSYVFVVLSAANMADTRRNVQFLFSMFLSLKK